MFADTLRLLCIAGLLATSQAANLILTNDDGWAVAMIRAQYESLVAANHSVVLSAPAENKSGTGSTSATPTPRTSACEFSSCPAGSPAVGYNATNTRFNYVNAYPVDSARYGIQTLAPQFFGGAPALVVSGPNVGLNTGTTVNVSGTVGAACEAAREGLPAVAFSASSSSISQVSYTTLSTTSSGTSAARVYAALTTQLVNALFASTSSAPLVPAGTILNVNYPAASGACASATGFKFVLSRVLANSGATDVTTCGTSHLPGEAAVVATSGCYASVSVVNATIKADVSAATQALVLQRLGNLLSCIPA